MSQMNTDDVTGEAKGLGNIPGQPIGLDQNWIMPIGTDLGELYNELDPDDWIISFCSSGP